MKSLGDLIKARRERIGLRLEDVARSLDRPTSFVWRIEQGRNANPPDPQTFRDLSKALNLPMSDMLVALGYLDADIDQEQFESPVERDFLRVIRATTWTPTMVTATLTFLEGIEQMARELQGVDVAPQDAGTVTRMEMPEDGEG